jgi:hypothetical protein
MVSERGNDPTDIHLSAGQERYMPRGHHADDGGSQSAHTNASCEAFRRMSPPDVFGSLLVR